MSGLAAEACRSGDPAEAARGCAALRDSILDLCAQGLLPLDDARALCREIEAVQSAALEPLGGMQRALDALDRACAETSARELPRLALEGAAAADCAVLLVAEGDSLAVRAA